MLSTVLIFRVNIINLINSHMFKFQLNISKLMVFHFRVWKVKKCKKDMFYIRFSSYCKYSVAAKQFSYLISPPSDQTVIILTNYQAMLKYGEGRVRDAEGMFVSSDKLTITVRWSGCTANYRCRPAKALQTIWLYG